MKLTDKPAQLGVPFASAGDKDTVPVNATQDTKEKGRAAWDSGFPPLTMTAIAAGGIPPSGKDFNGVLNAISAGLRFAMAGGLYPYDADFSAAIGGYPLGAILISADGSKVWWNVSDANTTDPDSDKAAGWKNLLQDPEGLFLKKAQNLADLQNKGTARTNLELDKVGNWVAVQQGGGTGMKDNKVYVGWDGEKTLLQIDDTPMGALFYEKNPPTPEDCNAFPAEGGSVGSKGVSSKGDIKADGSNIITRGGAYYIQNSDGVNIAIISASSGGTIEIRPLTGTAVVNTQAELHEYNQRVYSPNNPPPYPVTSVNGAMGAVTTATANLAGGWHKDVATGLITQWGFTQNSSTNIEAHSFNIAFPNVCTCIVATLGTGINNGNTVTANAINAQQFNCRTSGQLLGFHWLAIGY